MESLCSEAWNESSSSKLYAVSRNTATSAIAEMTSHLELVAQQLSGASSTLLERCGDGYSLVPCLTHGLVEKVVEVRA
jgi:hypothetical protein